MSRREETLSRELLRDGASPFRAPAGFEVANGGSGDAYRVDAAVFVEALILNRDDCFNQIRRDTLDRDSSRCSLKMVKTGLFAGVENRRRLSHIADAT